MDVRITSGAGLLQDIQVGRHHLLSDEPVSAGGADQGPTPYELLGAALGACTSMTLRMFAKAKGWPLQRVIVTVRHDKIHAQDCLTCEKKEGRIDRLEREIVLEGPLDDAQKKRLLEIADRCPVHRTLSREVQVVTRLRAP
jgi:putative redox protein